MGDGRGFARVRLRPVRAPAASAASASARTRSRSSCRSRTRSRTTPSTTRSSSRRPTARTRRSRRCSAIGARVIGIDSLENVGTPNDPRAQLEELAVATKAVIPPDAATGKCLTGVAGAPRDPVMVGGAMVCPVVFDVHPGRQRPRRAHRRRDQAARFARRARHLDRPVGETKGDQRRGRHAGLHDGGLHQVDHAGRAAARGRDDRRRRVSPRHAGQHRDVRSRRATTTFPKPLEVDQLFTVDIQRARGRRDGARRPQGLHHRPARDPGLAGDPQVRRCIVKRTALSLLSFSLAALLPSVSHAHSRRAGRRPPSASAGDRRRSSIRKATRRPAAWAPTRRRRSATSSPSSSSSRRSRTARRAARAGTSPSTSRRTPRSLVLASSIATATPWRRNAARRWTTAGGRGKRQLHDATGLEHGSLSQVYADTGIFFSTDPRTARAPADAFITVLNGLVVNPVPTGAGQLDNFLGFAGPPFYAHNEWDRIQAIAYGASGGHHRRYGQHALRVRLGRRRAGDALSVREGPRAEVLGRDGQRRRRQERLPERRRVQVGARRRRDGERRRADRAVATRPHDGRRDRHGRRDALPELRGRLRARGRADARPAGISPSTTRCPPGRTRSGTPSASSSWARSTSPRSRCA